MSNLFNRSGLFLVRATPRLRNAYRCAHQFRSLTYKSQATTPVKPLSPGFGDSPGEKRRKAAALAEDKKQFNRLAIATAVCLAITFGIVYFVPIPDKNNKPGALKADSSKQISETYQGKPVTTIAGGAKLLVHDESGDDIVLVPTGASAVPHFPKTIKLPDSSGLAVNDTEYTLVGLGVRSVSFLRVQVYVVGLYVQTASLASLQSYFIKRVNPMASALIPGEKEELRKALLDEGSYEIWDKLLKDPTININSAFRIVPTRNTDFRHMLDGWIRGITNRTQSASQKGDKQFSDESFAASVKALMELFSGRGKSPKSSTLLLTRDGDGQLGVLYQEQANKVENFGSVADERIARLIWLGYLGGKAVSSELARKSVVEGVIDLVERPVGTAAAKVE